MSRCLAGSIEAKPRCAFPTVASCRLDKYSDHDSPVLRAPAGRAVGRHGLGLAVADHVHLVQWNLVLLGDVPFDGFRAFETDAVVDARRADRVRMPFNLEIGAVRLRF